MALLRKGSSMISYINFNGRLQRENAKTGAVSVSLAWNDPTLDLYGHPSDLDLYGIVILEKGGKAEISTKRMFILMGCTRIIRDGEMVAELSAGSIGRTALENIFWKKPPAGVYSIGVKLSGNSGNAALYSIYKKRGTRETAVPFRAQLKRDGEEDLSREGVVENESGKREVECFRFNVDNEGEITMGDLRMPLPEAKPAPRPLMKVEAARRAVAKEKAKAKKTMKVIKVMKVMNAMKVMKAMKVPTIAKGKKAKVNVWRAKTSGGLKKEDLVKSKGGKIVSAKRSKQGRESKWATATAKARVIKGYVGFKAIKKGSSFHEAASKIMEEL